MNDESDNEFDLLVEKLTDEQHQMAADLILELLVFEDPHEAISVITYATADFLSQVAPNKESAMGAAVWMMACICYHLEQWDQQGLCDWNETRQ